MKIWKKTVIFLTVFSLFGTSCGSNEIQEEENSIELLEPIGVSGGYEIAAFRNIYDAKTYSAIVFPETNEYAFGENSVFSQYASYPGESVKKGSALIQTYTTSLEEQIKTSQELIAKMEQEHLELIEELENTLYESKAEKDKLQTILNNLKNSKPEEYTTSTVSSGEGLTQIVNPEYSQWLNEYDKYEARYTIAAQSVLSLETSMKQRVELYQIDYDYQCSQLNKLLEKLEESVLKSNSEGVVVALSYFNSGDYIADGVEVIAVGDTEKKVLKCDYIEKSIVDKAVDLYAMIDGVSYEIEYIPIDSSEYATLAAQGDKVYSTFSFAQESVPVQAGDYAVITIVKAKGEQVLSILDSGIHQESGNFFVYVDENGTSTRRDIKKGMSDGVYTEILTGIEEGDRVLVEESIDFGTDTSTIEYSDFSGNFSGSGYLYYPDNITMNSSISYGTAYFQTFQTALYQHVEKGDVLATLTVVKDEIAFAEKRQELARANERLSDLREMGEEENAKAIEAKLEVIANLQVVLADMEADASLSEIRAEKTGTIIWMADLESGSILQDNTSLVQIADESNCYIVLENEEQLLNYGNQVTITYQNRENQSNTTVGEVVTVAEAGVGSSNLKSQEVLIKIGQDALGDMAAATESVEGWWNRNRFEVSAQIREMEHVLVVPKKAVKEIDGNTYVCVENEDGSTYVTGFIAGGYDQQFYWVIDGLTERCKVCY